MDKVLLNEQLKKIVVKQQCKYVIEKLETELERKQLFKKNI